MRSKFSELIAQGVARFNYTPIIQETPCTDPVCLEYNNIFGPAMDTHMSMLEDGTRVITGHRVADECEWADFANSYRWNGIDFHDSGYHSLNEFFNRYGLTYTRGMLNGDIVMRVTKLEIPQETEMPVANESLTESLNVFMVTNKKTNKSYIVVANDEKESIDLVPDDSKNDLKSSKVNIKTPKGFTKPIIIKDSDQVINESEIEQILNEAKTLKLDTFINFDLQSDIYNTLSDLAMEYNSHNKNFDEKDVKKALDWFMKNFFIDESLMESKDCIACDKETVKNVMQDLEDEGYDISVIHDILSDNYKELDSLIRKPNKLLLKFVLGINPKPGKHLDIEGSINAAKKAWK